MLKPFEIKEICTNLRPAKVAVLVHKGWGWQDKCLKIIENFSQIWGGQKNLIIPTDGKKIDKKFWFLLEKFDPDYFYIYNDPNGNRKEYKFISEGLKKEILKRLNPFYESRTGKDPIEKAFFRTDWPLTFLPNIIPNANIEEKKIYNPVINYPIADSPDYVKLMVHSVLGKMTEDYSKKINDQDIKIEEKNFTEDELFSLLKNLVWEDKSQENYPFWYSMLKLSFYGKKGDNINQHPVILVIGDSLNDFCLYYNLSSLRKDVLWAPSSFIKNSFRELKKIRESEKKSSSKLTLFNLALIGELDDKFGYSEKEITFTSISKSKSYLKNIKDILRGYMTWDYELKEKECISISKDFEELLPYKLNVLEYDNYSNCYREQFINSKSINRIKTPIPRNFDHRSFDHHYWITEVNIEGYKLPLYKKLNNTLEAGHYSNHEIRISSRGIAYFCPNYYYMGESIDKYLIKPYIKLLRPFEIFERIFKESDYCIVTSDKGNYERESTEKFGSLEKIGTCLIDEKYQQLFNKFIEKENPDPGEGIFLKDDNRMYMNLKSIENILGDEINPIINDFVEKGILHRGFIFKCEKCKYAGWYDIEEVTNTFKCKRCRTAQYYNSNSFFRQNPIEPEWFYKLDEAIYQGYDNDMIVPILTLNKLKKLSKESFLYTNEIEIRKMEHPNEQYREIDICCISDGKIVIGECKRHNKLEKEEIKKYKDVYEEIGADKIIFSTFNEKGWSECTINKIKIILGEEVNYEIFTKKDLCS